jgi:hypothetical protein
MGWDRDLQDVTAMTRHLSVRFLTIPFNSHRAVPPASTHRRLLAALVLLGVTLFLFPLALGHPLLDPDEGLHAAIAQEMVERGDYITPRFLGDPFPDKPVLFFWALAGSLRAFGFTEPATRAPGLVSAPSRRGFWRPPSSAGAADGWQASSTRRCRFPSA